MTPNFGIYQAIVTDNSQFFTNGKIKVRIQNMYNGKLNWDLSNDFDYNEFIQELVNDVWALVYTPIGGGSNHGLFALPQINSVGLVQFMNGNIKKPIWMGSFFRPEYDQNGKLARANVPNDQPNYEGEGADGLVGNENGIGQKKIEGGFGTLILRTKTTSGPGADKSADHMDFDLQKSENLLVLSEDKAQITHFSKWEMDGDTPVRKQWQDVELGTHKTPDANGNIVDEYPEIQVSVSDVDNRDNLKVTSLVINNNEVALNVSDEAAELESSISSTSDGININAKNTDNGDNTSIQMNASEILLINKEATILMEGNEVSISVPNGKLRLSGQEVILGDGGGYIVTKDNKSPMRMEDGSILKASNVKA